MAFGGPSLIHGGQSQIGIMGVVRRPSLLESRWVDGLWPKVCRITWEAVEGVTSETALSVVDPVRRDVRPSLPHGRYSGVFKAGYIQAGTPLSMSWSGVLCRDLRSHLG